MPYETALSVTITSSQVHRIVHIVIIQGNYYQNSKRVKRKDPVDETKIGEAQKIVQV
jgi:hypothetical protein